MITVPGTITTPTAGAILASVPMRVRAIRPILFPGGEMPTGAEGVHLGTVDGGRPLVAWFDRPWHDDRHMRMCFDIPASDRANLAVPVVPNMDALARWLARHHGLTFGPTAPVWFYEAARPGRENRDTDGCYIDHTPDCPAMWVLVGDGCMLYFGQWDPDDGPAPAPSDGIDVWLTEWSTDPAEALRIAVLAASTSPAVVHLSSSVTATPVDVPNADGGDIPW